MYTFDNLSDPISKHFRHPIPEVLHQQYGIKTIEQMVIVNPCIVYIRGCGTKSLIKINDFKELYNKRLN
jgi:hypothetical protein